MKELKRCFITAICMLMFLLGHAAKRYWIGNGSNINWNTTNNWSASSGGASGASVPGSNDTAYFNSGGLGQCKLDVNISIKRLVMDTVFADTLKQNGKTITLGTGGASLNSGYFWCDNASVTSSGAITIAGCYFKSTSGTLSISSNLTFSSGTFVHNSGKLKATATLTVTGEPVLYDLETSPTGSTSMSFVVASGDSLVVENDLTITGTSGWNATNVVNTGVLNLKGDIHCNNPAYGGGTGQIRLCGNGTQTINGRTTWDACSRLPDVKIDKSGSDTLILKGYTTVAGDWNYVNGIIDATTNNSTVALISTSTITGSHSLDNVFFSSAPSTFTIAGGTTLTVSGDLKLIGTQDLYINTGNVDAKGDIYLSSSYRGGGTATITINGTGNQTINGHASVFSAVLPKVTINKSGGTLYFKDNISVGHNWTYTAGTIDATTYTNLVAFCYPLTVTGSHTLNNVTYYGSGYNPYSTVHTVAGGTTFNVSGTLTFAYIMIASGTVHAQGNITLVSTSTSVMGPWGVNGYVDINGTGNQTITGAGYLLAGGLAHTTIDKASGDLTLSGTVAFGGHLLYTRGNVVPGSSVASFYSNFNLDAEGASSFMSFNDVNFTYNQLYPSTEKNRTLLSKLVAAGHLTLTSGTLSSSGYDVFVGKNWTNNGTYTHGNSKVTFDGSGNQWVSKTSGTETFYKVTINKSGGKVYGLNPVDINNNLTLTKGIYKSTSTNLIRLIDNATLTGGSDSSYVHGPFKKTGNDPFTFAVGDTTLSGPYHPLSITAPSATTDAYTVEYSPTNALALYGSTKVDSLETISTAEYWVLTRNAGSSTVTPKLGWNTNNGILGSQADMTVTGHNGSNWIDLGATSMTLVGTTQGTLTATVGVNAASIALTFAKKKATYALLKRKLDGGYYQVTNNKLRFKYDEEYNDTDNLLSFRIYKTSDNSVAASDSHVQNIFKKVYYGDNRYAYDVSLLNGGLASGDYILEVTNEKSEKQFMRFKK